MKNFYSSEDTLKRVKRQATEWEEIFVTCMSNNEHISKIFFKLLQINKKKDRGSNRKLEKRTLQKDYSNGQSTYERVLNLISHQGNANESHS